MKIDLHCHSKWSKRPALWIMQKLGCPESFTEPRELYELARRKGMNWVTITDHNVIDGALEIADLPNTFTGCEYTTYFPEDNCKVHILVYGQTEAQHTDLTKARENIFDLVRYLTESGLHHICAHPLFWINDRLTINHVEKLVLLFKNWEINGDMTPTMNDAVFSLIQRLTSADIDRLTEKHGIEPHYEKPWEKNFTAGSDDHSSLHLASAYTSVPEAETLEDFWAGLHEGHAKVSCTPASPQHFARNMYGIAYQFYKAKFGLEKYTRKDVFLHFLEESLQARSTNGVTAAPPWYHRLRTRHRTTQPHSFATHSLFQMARHEAEKHILEDPQLYELVQGGNQRPDNLDQTWFEFVTRVSDKVFVQFGEHLIDRALRGRIFDLFHSIGSAGSLYALLAPYFVGFSLHRSERVWSDKVLKQFGVHGDGTPATQPRLAHFTDTYDDFNGVARTLQQHLELAQKVNRDYTILTSFAEAPPRRRGVRSFKPVGAFTLPDYPELQLLVPPFLRMLAHCYDEGYTHLHVATPGPLGLAALGIARILRLPISGTYHTAFPQYGKDLTDDSYVEEVLWRFMTWFYNQLDSVYVPSRATAAELVERGLDPGKVRLYPRGCDIERFHPKHGDRVVLDKYGVPDGPPCFLYVGRVSKEKSLDTLTAAFRGLITQGENATLLVVGGGPYREEMQRELAELPAVFTGYVDGPDLGALFASADCFVFPSTTDTFGNVVLEAQASGIPVIVSDTGGPHENMLDDETGFVVPGRNAEKLREAMHTMSRSEDLRRRMGAAARCYMEGRDFDSAFERLYAMYVEEDTPRHEPLDLSVLLNPAPRAESALSF